MNYPPISPGPNILLDPDILSGAVSPTSLMDTDIQLLGVDPNNLSSTAAPSASQTVESSWASDGSAEFRDALERPSSAASSVANTVIHAPPPPVPVVPPPPVPVAPPPPVPVAPPPPSPVAAALPNRRPPIGPPRLATIRVNGFAYSKSMNIVLRIADIYATGRVRCQDPLNARRRPLLDPDDLVAIPGYENTPHIRDLRDQLAHLRQQRDGWERQIYGLQMDLDRVRARNTALEQELEHGRSANRELSAQLVTLEKQSQRTPQVRSIGCNTSSEARSVTCTPYCRHFRRLQQEMKSLRKTLKRARTASSSSDGETN